MAITINTLTANGIAQRLQADGLSSLGLTTPLLAPRWSRTDAAPSFDDETLQLSVADVGAPFRGICEWLPHGQAYTGADGQPYANPVAVLRLHPQAAQRLQRLAASRYTDGVQPLAWAVPQALVVQLASAVDEAPQRLEAGDAIAHAPATALVSFHDGRGQIICPIAVAAMCHDLRTAFGALADANATGAPGDSSGVQSLIALAPAGVRVALSDLHGDVFQAAAGGATMEVVRPSGSGFAVQRALGSGHDLLAAGELLRGTAGTALRWGLAQGGRLDRQPLVAPALPAGLAPGLARRFMRVAVVEPAWHLLGNRSAAEQRGIGPDDQATPADLLPPVRDRIALNFLVDGPDVLAASSQTVARMAAAGSGVVVACSPAFEAIGLPPAPGPTAHWPAFPASAANAPLAPGLAPLAASLSAQWLDVSGPDVVVAIAGAALPDGAHVRVFERQFVEIAAIGPQPSFVRGDGGAGLKEAGTDPLLIRLRNPFHVAEGAPQPADVTLHMDVVVTPRSAAAGARRLFAGLAVPVAAGPAPAVVENFGGTDRLPALPANMRGVCGVPLFGLPSALVPAAGSPGTLEELVRRLASESTPRTGPRLPFQARFESVVASGVADPAATNGALAWQAVCSGLRWTGESRSSAHELGNPGNPAGPDVLGGGLQVSGQLAYDLAWHALRRARPALPLPGSPGGLDGWLLFAAGDNFNLPAEPTSDTAADGTPLTGLGAALQTVAAGCETPELALAPASLFTTAPTVQGIVNDLASRLGVSPPTVSAANADRQLAQLRREYFVARRGRRDALWSLRRAFSEARELVYIEGAQFAATAAEDAEAPAAVDLLQVLKERMESMQALQVVVCVPRQTDMDAQRFGAWVRQALAARKTAAQRFTQAAALPGEAASATQARARSLRERFLLFHPMGFPGRAVQVRGSTVVVDDVYALVGSAHLRRRGMAFDGALDVACLDRAMDEGYSLRIRQYRRQLMALRLGVAATGNPAAASAEWVRLATPSGSFALVRDMLAQGGLGRIQPLWEGPTDAAVLPQSDAIADPDGSDASLLLGLLGALLSPES